MVFFNYTTMELAAKIVYYGPGLCGKTTNLQYIYRKTAPKTRGEMVCLATETDRTLFFDLLPIKLGNIGGFNTRFQLYTVPGQVFYNSTRKLVLKGVDAVVFVADSQEPMLDANIESFENLEENLREHNLDVSSIPLVLQYNKRDLPNTLPVAELDRYLNKHGFPRFEAVATVGKGVLTTLKEISKLTLKYIRRKVGQPFAEEAEVLAAATPSSAAKPAAPARTGSEEEVEFDISGGSEVSEAGRLVVPTLEPRASGPGDRSGESRPLPAGAGIPAPRSERDGPAPTPAPGRPAAAAPASTAKAPVDEVRPARPMSGPLEPIRPADLVGPEIRGGRPIGAPAGRPGAEAATPADARSQRAPEPLGFEVRPPGRSTAEPARPVAPEPIRPAADPVRPGAVTPAPEVAADPRVIRPLTEIIAEAGRPKVPGETLTPPPILGVPSSTTVELPLEVEVEDDDQRVLEKEIVQKVRVPINMSEVNGHQKIRLRLKLEVECVVIDAPDEAP